MPAAPSPPALPALLTPRFSRATREALPRLLKTARVANTAFFRQGFSGEVVLASGRLYAATLALDADGEVASALCGCSPKLRPTDLCVHILAVVASLLRGGTEPRLPNDVFAHSLWHRLAEGLLEEASDAGIQHAVEETADRVRLLVTDRAGRRRVDLSLRPDSQAASLLAAAFPASGSIAPNRAVKAREELLRKLTLTAYEKDLNRAGTKTRRQALEDSFWYRLVRACFSLLGEDQCPFEVAVDADGFRFERRDPSAGIELGVWPARSTIGALLAAEEGGFFARRGFRVAEGPAPSCRVSLRPDGGLLLSPVVVLPTADGGVRFVDRREMSLWRFDAHHYVAELRVFLREDEAGPFFAEPEPGEEPAFSFDDTFRPSPIGISKDRPTTVPAQAVVKFLTRHRAELASLPAELVPAELLAEAAGEPPGETVVTLHGERDGLFLLSVDFDAAGRALPLGEVLAARRGGDLLLVHHGHLVDLSDASFGWLDWLGKRALEVEGGETRLRLTPLEYLLVRSNLPGARLRAAEGVSLAPLLALEGGSLEGGPSPERLGVPLYDFQENGFRWLWFLLKNGFGGLLCDDMGLGKTHQAMALMRAMQLENAPLAPRVLVVCPASLLPHWEEKLTRYLPSLPFTTHHGAGRHLAAPAPLTLTSYATLRNDIDLLAKETYDLFVLDEIQTIKNRESATHQALRRVQARLAVGLTGTPVENSVGDLRTLLDFVLPGYLPGEAAFRRAFTVPIEEEGNGRAHERLSALVHPFVLRRTKAQVLTELPEKIVDRRTCALAPEQAALYREVLERRARPLIMVLDEAPYVPHLHIFAVLSLLKQICNHPGTVPGAPAEHAELESGKWNLFSELLDECLSSGLKVVVFSQYLRMLARIEEHLAAREIGFASLKGSTVDRGEPLRRFARDPACRVFAASLKAGGLGIDLTAASVVIHYDRWWNLAREEQATDRVHRLGQTRGVQVIKLVTKGTVEERIDAIIERKRGLAGIVAEDDPHLAKTFTKEELRELLVG